MKKSPPNTLKILLGILIIGSSLYRIVSRIYKTEEHRSAAAYYIDENSDDSKALSLFLNVQSLYDNKEYDESIKKLKKALESKNLSKEVKSKMYYNLAVVYKQVYKYDSAIYYSKLDNELLDKNSAEYFDGLGIIYQLEKKTDSAIIMFEKSLSINKQSLTPNNNLGLMYMGLIYSDTINYEKALEYNIKAYQVSEQRATEEVLIKNYKALKLFDKVAEHYSNLCSQFPKNTDYLYQYTCTVYDNLEDTSKAKKLAKELIKIDSSYANYYKIKEILK